MTYEQLYEEIKFNILANQDYQFLLSSKSKIDVFDISFFRIKKRKKPLNQYCFIVHRIKGIIYMQVSTVNYLSTFSSSIRA